MNYKANTYFLSKDSRSGTIPHGPVIVKVVHQYDKEGPYETIVVITSPAEIIPTFHQRVTSCEKPCSVKNVKIVGASSVAASSPVIRQEFRYSLQAQIEVNCLTSKQLLYKWEIYMVNNVTIQKLHKIEKLETNSMDLSLWAFSLEGGLYKVVLTVTSQPCGVLKMSHGFIRVREVNLVASIDCGSVRSVSWNSKIVLDASGSYDPSDIIYSNSIKKGVKYEWICKDINGVNCLEKISTTNSSLLAIPPRYFNLSSNSTYVFVLKVSKGSRFSEARQVVEVRKQSFASNLCIR